MTLCTNDLYINDVNSLSKDFNIKEAELILKSLDENSAEWNYLYSLILTEKGWFDSGIEHLKTAMIIEPKNKKYRIALLTLHSRMNGYSNNYYRTTRPHNHSSCCCCCCDCCDCGDCDCCMKLWCADSCCECMGSDLITCC